MKNPLIAPTGDQPTQEDVNERMRRFISRWWEESSKTLKEERSNISNVMIELLRQGADIHTCHHEYGTSIFMFAAKYCTKKVIDVFMERTASSSADRERLFMDKTTFYGQNAAFYAIYNEDANVMKFILNNASAVSEVRDKKGWTLLMYAAQQKNVEAVLELIEKPGLDVNARNCHGETALCCFLWASEADDVDIRIAEILLDHGADFSGSLRSPIIPVLLNIPRLANFSIAKVSALTPALYKGNIPLVKLLLNRGVFKDDSKENKSITLSDAMWWMWCRNRNNVTELIKLFLNAGTSPCGNSYCQDFYKPIAQAAGRYGKIEMVELMLALCPKEEIEEAKEIALRAAIKDWSVEIVKFILEQGVEVNKSMDKRGRTPLFYTVCDSLNRDTKLEIAKLLLQYGAGVDIGDDDGRSALQYVSWWNIIDGNDRSSKEQQALLKALLDRDEDQENGISPEVAPKNSASSSSAEPRRFQDEGQSNWSNAATVNDIELGAIDAYSSRQNSSETIQRIEQSDEEESEPNSPNPTIQTTTSIRLQPTSCCVIS